MGLSGQRLDEVTPYPLPRRGSLTWFLCRWEGGEPLRASLPADATARERDLLHLALASWEHAGLGVRFEPVEEPAGADLVISIDESDDARAGSTGAECAVAVRGDRLAARLVHADVALRRWSPDTRGHRIPLTEAEWLGAALHELGHALGFQGHTRGGSGIMVRDVDQVRGIGGRVLRGEALRAPSLQALYRLPSGALLARLPLTAGRTAAIDRLGELAEAKGYRGPLVRVGDGAARIAWWSADGSSVGVSLPGIRDAMRDPERLEIVPDLRAEAWLAAGGGRGGR